MHFWCDLSCDLSYSFCRAENVHDNHQCCLWGNLMYIDMIFQYCIILEIIICRSLETLFVSWFHNSFFLISFHDRRWKTFFVKFLVLATYPKTTHTTKWMFDVIFMWYFCQICTTTQKCIFYVICHGIFCTCLYSWTMHYNHECCQWLNLLHIYAVCQYQIIVEIIIWTSVHNMYVFSVWIVSYYLHAYNTEWYHLYWTLYKELCPW